MIFPVLELAVSAALGGLDGWVASTDSNAGRVSLTQQRSTWVKGGAFLAGVALDFAGWNEAVTESLMGSSLALFTRELAFKGAQSGRATPTAAQGYSAYVAAPFDVQPGFGGVQQYTQPVSVLG